MTTTAPSKQSQVSERLRASPPINIVNAMPRRRPSLPSLSRRIVGTTQWREVATISRRYSLLTALNYDSFFQNLQRRRSSALATDMLLCELPLNYAADNSGVETGADDDDQQADADAKSINGVSSPQRRARAPLAQLRATPPPSSSSSPSTVAAMIKASGADALHSSVTSSVAPSPLGADSLHCSPILARATPRIATTLLDVENHTTPLSSLSSPNKQQLTPTRTAPWPKSLFASPSPVAASATSRHR